MQLVSLGLGMELGGQPRPEQMQRFVLPTNDTALPLAGDTPCAARPTADGADLAAATRPHRRRARPPLVSGDRLQPLHQLHGVHRLLPVRRVRRRQGRDDSRRAARQLPQGLPRVQPRLPRKRDHLSAAQDADDRRRVDRGASRSRSTSRSCSARPKRANRPSRRPSASGTSSSCWPAGRRSARASACPSGTKPSLPSRRTSWIR